MKILFAGTPDIAAETLRVLATDPRFAQFEVAAVLTREDAPQGRKRILTASAVAHTAVELGIPVIKANRLTSENESDITATGAKFAIVVAYGVILKTSTLEALPQGWYNLHYSLLPAYRGSAPVQRALLAGASATGVTLFKLDAGMDTGPILNVVETQVQPDETTEELLPRLGILAHSLLAESMPAIASGSAALTPQPLDGASLAPKLTRADALLAPNSEARQLENQVRACNPEPTAYFMLDDSTIRVSRARALAERDASALAQLTADRQIGEAFVANDKVLVRCGTGLLQLLEVQPAGKNRMKATDWMRGTKQRIVFGDDHGK